MLIGYARVSTDDQDLALQVDALKAAGCKKIYREKASGSKTDRPQLEKMLSALREGDTIAVWRLDRLGRSMKHLVTVVAQLEEAGVGFMSLTEGFDTTTNGGRLVFNIFASLAEFERNLIRERTNAGLKAARARGRKGGRPAKLSEKEKERIKVLMADRDSSPDEIAERYKISRATLYRIIKA